MAALCGLALAATVTAGCAGSDDSGGPAPSEAAAETTPGPAGGSASDGAPVSSLPDESISSGADANETASVSPTAESATDTNSTASTEPAVFTISDQPPTARDSLAPGVVVGQQISGTSPGTAAYVILSVDADLAVSENWRFDILTATAADNPSYSPDALAPGSFSSDFTKLAGTADYDLDRGSDPHIGYFAPDGSFTDLSGRTDAQEQLNQTRPVFGPDDRLYYWQFQTKKPSQLLMSVNTDGSDRRAEDQWQDLVPAGQPFHFSQGHTAVPVYDQKPEVAVSDDNTIAVTAQYGKVKVGAPTALADATQFTLTGATPLTVVAFQPGNSTDFIATDGTDIIAASINPEAHTIQATTLTDLNDKHVQGTPETITVLDTHTLTYTITNNITAGPDHLDVTRIVMRQIDSSKFAYANLARADNQHGYPVIIGHTT